MTIRPLIVLRRWLVRRISLMGAAALVCIGSPSDLAGQLAAFPGAEGFGSTTPGGRGGKVIKVTSVSDSGPGTFRHACETSGPRIVVFDVSGTLRLESDISIRDPFITISGQTAPGDGITLTNYPLRVRTHDVIIRGIRFRMGDFKANRNAKEPNYELEALHIIGSTAGAVFNVIVDHCSVSWGIDKNIGVWGNERKYGSLVHDITIQWCISSEALNTPLHPKGESHSMGMVFASVQRASSHHNLIAHCNSRNPQFSKYTEGEAINNVVFDWGNFGTKVQAGARVNLIGNYFKAGRSWSGKMKGIYVEQDETRFGKSAVYVKGNIGPGRPSDDQDEWGAVHGNESFRSLTPVVEGSGITAQTAEEAYENVLTFAGDLPHDSVDLRVIRDVRNGTGSLITSQDDVGGLPELGSGPVPPDTDNDGIPDEWERAFNLDQADPADASRDRDGDGYTNIEEYINGLLQWK